MTLTKLILSESQGFDRPAVSLVPVLRSGAVSRDWLTKTAGEIPEIFRHQLSELNVRPDQTVLHVLAVGDYEGTGFNRNGDGFLEADNKTCHTRFKKEGHVFKDHKHKDPSLKTGDVLATAHNDPMRRIELLIALDNDKNEKEVQAVNEGKDVPVSMGTWQDHDTCFPAGTQVSTEQGTLPIEQLADGDLVLTHRARYRRVLRTMRRDYTGSLVTISAVGLPRKLVATANHPVLVLPRAQLYAGPGGAHGRKRRLRKNDLNFPAPVWRLASEVEIDDYVLSPVTPSDADAAYSEDLAYAIGAAYGNGSVFGKQTATMGWRYRGVRYSMDLRDTDRITKLSSALQAAGITVHRYDDAARNECALTAQDMEFAELVDRLIGRGSREKHLSHEVLSWNQSARVALAGGLIDSDGSVDQKSGKARYSTTSASGAYGVYRLFLSLGMIPSAHVETSRAGFSTSPVEIYVISLGCAEVARLVVSSIRAARGARVGVCAAPKTLDAGAFAAYRVQQVSSREVQDLEVFNLSVEEDETYVANWMQVHNCSWCHHKAKTAKEHCDHIKHNLGDVNADGVECGMLNPDPHYFDISTVYRPADRIGYTLRKVAGQRKIAGHELAVEAGLVRPGITKRSAMIRLAELEKRIGGIARAPGPGNLTDEVRKLLKRACRVYGTDAVLARLHREGRLLGPEDFAEAILGHEKVAEAGAAIRLESDGIFGRINEAGESLDSLDGNPIKIAAFGPELDEALDRECSLSARRLATRALAPQVKTASSHSLDHAEARGLADLYAHYRVAFATQAYERDEPTLALAALVATQPH